MAKTSTGSKNRGNGGNRAASITNTTKWLKTLTYIAAAVLLIVNNNFDKLTYLIPLVILLVLVSYFRDYRLLPENKPVGIILASIAVELVLIICIGLFDTNDINLLFYFVCISSAVITQKFLYSIPLAAIYIISSFFIYAERTGLESLAKEFVPRLLSYIVPTIFVAGMSYLVRMQIREKEKLARLNAELEQAYKKLIDNSALEQKLSLEQERIRMARDLHDTLANTLTTLIIELETCKKLAVMDIARLQAELEKAQELSRSGFNDIKRSIKALRPQVMEDKSFFDAIISTINSIMENAKVNITLKNQLPSDIKFSSQFEVVMFRVIQESITNSIRHGQAVEIEIAIKHENNLLQLNIADNGIGCSNIKKGYGMKGIRERVESLDGSVEFSSSHGKGFRTMVSIPCEV